MRDGTADAPHAFGCCGLSGKVFCLQELVEYTDGLPGRVERRADLATRQEGSAFASSFGERY